MMWVFDDASDQGIGVFGSKLEPIMQNIDNDLTLGVINIAVQQCRFNQHGGGGISQRIVVVHPFIGCVATIEKCFYSIKHKFA